VIAFIKGSILAQDLESVTVLAGSVGYDLTCSRFTLDEIFGKEFVELWVHTQVREDAIQLFGFHHLRERDMFLNLIKVNGIGPKSAINIVSAAPLKTLHDLIESGDAKGLSSLPKVGKKTAEQMILTLKGKLVEADAVSVKDVKMREEVASALQNLGFKLSDVERVIEKLDPSWDVERAVRESLNQIAAQI